MKNSFGINVKKLKNKTAIYSTDDASEVQVLFEDATYDFDTIESTFNLYADVKRHIVFTRSLHGKKEAVKEAIDIMQNHIRLIDDKVFTKSFAKNFNKFREDLTMCYITLQAM